MSKYNLVIFADSFQFYLQDETSNKDLSDSWSEDAVENLLAATPEILGVGTVRNMYVPVEIIVEDSPQEEDISIYDKVNECSLELASGQMVVAGTTDYFPDAPRIVVKPGAYRLRIYYKNLDKISDDGLEGEDTYKIVMWPQSPYEPIKKLK